MGRIEESKRRKEKKRKEPLNQTVPEKSRLTLGGVPLMAIDRRAYQGEHMTFIALQFRSEENCIAIIV